jgi:ribonucleoside-diphosphate reductase alpha chain
VLKSVIKYDGSVEEFRAEKLNKWAQYATKTGGDWSEIAISTYKRLPEIAKASDIHQTMINVCLDKEEIGYSRIAARLEQASLRKNMERLLHVSDRDSFKDIYNEMIGNGVWDKATMPEYNPVWESWYEEIYPSRLEYWQIVQWGDKYAIRKDGVPVETPHIGCMGIGLGLHGDSQDAFDLAKALVEGKVNLPTPALNGIRTGDFDTISCCIITGGDTVDSIGVAEHIAYKMTAKKAGIGIEFDTRSKGSPVKGGAVEHLGKHSIYATLDRAVKMFTQVSRGGSATVTFKCIDPEVESIVMWKTQRVDIETRLDKMDYSFAYNDAFLQAVINNEDWYLFDLVEAPEVHDAFYVLKAVEYNEVVKKSIDGGKKFKKLKARDLLKSVLIARNETGRVYSINVTRVNEHTPFIDVVRLSNLCQEICLVTNKYVDMQDLYAEESIGETAFCTLAAINAAKVKLAEYEHVANVALKAVDKMIDKAPMMTASMKNSIMKRRSAGIGITGLASALYKNGLDYDGSEESFNFVSQLAEHHYFYLLKASQQLSKESGYAVEGIKKDWLPIDTGYNKGYTPALDWESLRGKDRKHSVLVAHMPTESSALFCDAPNSLYPIRQAVINKKSRKGVIQYICKEWTKGNLLAWDVDNTTLAKYYSRVQDFSDQAISADYYFDPSKYVDEKKPLSELMKEWVVQAKLGNKTQYYMNTRDYNGGGIQELLSTEVEEEACESCKL